MLTDTQVRDYVCSANAVSLPSSGVPQVKLAIVSQQKFRAWDVASQNHFHSWSHKVPPDYQVTKAVEEEINNTSNGVTRTRSPTFLTENIFKKTQYIPPQRQGSRA